MKAQSPAAPPPGPEGPKETIDVSKVAKLSDSIIITVTDACKQDNTLRWAEIYLALANASNALTLTRYACGEIQIPKLEEDRTGYHG